MCGGRGEWDAEAAELESLEVEVSGQPARAFHFSTSSADEEHSPEFCAEFLARKITKWLRPLLNI